MNVQLLQQLEENYLFSKGEGSFNFTKPDVSFTSNNNTQKRHLQALLKELVDRTGSGGGLLIFRQSFNRSPVQAGHIQSNVHLTPNDERLLRSGEIFIKNDFLIQPVQHKQQTAGIICIKCDGKICLKTCKNIIRAYALLVAQEIEMDWPEKTSPEPEKRLKKEKKQLEEIQQYNKKLLSITAHDLSSPLNAVSGYLEMIDDFFTNDKGKEKLHHYFQRIQSGVNDMTDMLEQLNEVIKFKEGRQNLNSVQVDANWLVHDVCGLLKAIARKKNIKLSIKAASTPAYIKADIVKFKRIIYNLVSNAIKYTDDDQCINIRILNNGDEVEIRVKDEGGGIAEDELNTIFQPFVKHKTSDEDVFSKGLGLYITSYFVELMGGQIEAKSKLGKGTVFTVTMPEVAAPTLEKRTA